MYKEVVYKQTNPKIIYLILVVPLSCTIKKPNRKRYMRTICAIASAHTRFQIEKAKYEIRKSTLSSLSLIFINVMNITLIEWHVFSLNI